eukprot:ANDGO_01532.mRNA.1 hypothetical protein
MERYLGSQLEEYASGMASYRSFSTPFSVLATQFLSDPENVRLVHSLYADARSRYSEQCTRVAMKASAAAEKERLVREKPASHRTAHESLFLSALDRYTTLAAAIAQAEIVIAEKRQLATVAQQQFPHRELVLALLSNDANKKLFETIAGDYYRKCGWREEKYTADQRLRAYRSLSNPAAASGHHVNPNSYPNPSMNSNNESAGGHFPASMAQWNVSTNATGGGALGSARGPAVAVSGVIEKAVGSIAARLQPSDRIAMYGFLQQGLIRELVEEIDRLRNSNG